MANTLTSLAPDLFEDLDTISREAVGFIPAVTLDASAERAAVGQTIRSFVAPASSASSISPGQIAPNTGDQTIGNVSLSISKAYQVPVRWNGEEQISMNSGAGYRNILRNQFRQAMRTLVNLVEVDVGSLSVKASRAYGTASTDAFATTLIDTANLSKILTDNGAPMFDRHLVINTAAGAKVRNISNLYKMNEAGDGSLLRQGILGSVHGFDIRESAGVRAAVTVGTASGATTDNAGYAVGATTLTLASAGTGTLLAGDVITFAGDTNKYVVLTGDADVSNGGTVVIGAPGLQVAMSAATKAITVVAASSQNMAFAREAIVLVTRAPAAPVEGDLAVDSMIVQDERTGLAIDVRMYKEYRQIHFELALAWGYAMVKPEHCAVLLGA